MILGSTLTKLVLPTLEKCEITGLGVFLTMRCVLQAFDLLDRGQFRILCRDGI